MRKSFTNEFALSHIKDLTPSSMTVFITEPVRIERKVFFIPARVNQERFAKATKDGYVLTDTGCRKVEDTLEKLYTEANFFVSHKDTLRCFSENYQQEYERVLEASELTKERLKTAAHWHDRAVLFRQKCTLGKQLISLYGTMYEAQFGKEAVYIGREQLEVLLEDNNNVIIMAK